MSCFTLKTWWNASCSTGREEEFDLGSLAIGNLDNVQPPSDKIAVGSQQGILRIYNPSHPEYRVDDLIYEGDLGQPILQILIGLFIPASDDMLAIAVLHPRKLVIYELVPSGKRGVGGGQHHHYNDDGGSSGPKAASYYTLEKCYENELGIFGKHFTAYNMVSGHFGGVLKREMIMVQSLDGKLQIFEQSANAFTRQLVDCVIPGPLCYLPRLDAFVTSTYASQVECYRYQVLANAQATTEDAPGSSIRPQNLVTGAFGLTALRSALVEWSINLGESCRQIIPGYFSRASDLVNASNENVGKGESKADRGGGGRPSGSELLMLCERSMYLVKESGGILQQRRLERQPSCACSYPIANGAGHNILLATQDHTLQVYSDLNLVWAAKTETIPVQVAVGNFGNKNGLIVTLDETGKLAISYLGTKPPTKLSAGLRTNTSREMDFAKMEQERKALLQRIKDIHSETKSEPKDRLIMRCQVMPSLDKGAAASFVGDSSAPPHLVPLSSIFGDKGDGASMKMGSSGFVKTTARLYITFHGSSGDAATKVNVCITAPSFVHVVPSNIIFDKISGNQATPLIVQVAFYASKQAIATSLEAQVVASYNGPSGDPRVTSIAVPLPFHLACCVRPAAKSAQYKFTLDTAAAAQPLTDLFDDFLFAQQEAGLDIAEVLGSNAGQAMGFQLWTCPSTDAHNVEGNPNDGTDNRDRVSGKASKGNDSSSGALVSVLVSKAAGRYRIQSDSLPALTLVVSELERRLCARLKDIGTPLPSTGCYVSFADNLPLPDLFSIGDAHLETRLALEAHLSALNDAAHQFRLIEKRLLVRFKDKSPTPLAGLDVLMKESYSRLLSISDKVSKGQLELQRIGINLSSVCYLLHNLTCMKYGFSVEEREALRAFLCIDERVCQGIGGTAEQGWEEIIDANMSFLLKTCLAKSLKDTTSLPENALVMPRDSASFKKHIAMAFDRFAKGGRPILPKPSPPSASPPSPTKK